MQIDGELVAWGGIVGIELQRPLGLAQRALVVAQSCQREAEIVPRRCEVRVQLHRAHERVPRFGGLFQRHQRIAESVPDVRPARVALEHPAVKLQATLRPLGSDPEQTQVELRVVQLWPRLEGALESELRAGHVASVRAEHADVVPGECVTLINLQGATITLLRVFQPPHLMQGDAPLVPDLRTFLHR